jgi:hypothetical protein
MWNDKPDRYLIPARNPMGTGMNFYPRVRVWVQIFTRSLFAGGRLIALPDPNPTRCHPYCSAAALPQDGFLVAVAMAATHPSPPISPLPPRCLSSPSSPHQLYPTTGTALLALVFCWLLAMPTIYFLLLSALQDDTGSGGGSSYVTAEAA